jgi:hypothetical protein
MRWLFLLTPILALGVSSEIKPASPEFNVESIPVSGGAELLTVFSNVPGENDPVPLLSVLRDTLGDDDPTNDRLRYVWTLTSASPSLLQHAAAAIPFYYWRTGVTPNADKTPRPAIDLGDTELGVFSSFAQQIVQMTVMDPNGMFFRAPTRHYRTNLTDQMHLHLMEALAVLSELERQPEAREALSDQEMFEIEARMELASQTLGGLVTPSKLPEAYRKQRVRREETRGHNWELLRQRAEMNGLYFDPLGMGGDKPTHAILWIDKDEAASARSFNGKFLGISNPYNDPRIRNWKGVRVTRYFDESGRAVDSLTSGAKAHELIPLALYGLDYPKVPLLLIDFRNTTKTKQREMFAKAVSDAIVGVLGYSKWGNWPYMVGSFAYSFAATRWGQATNRELRLKAYAEVRRWLVLDHALTPELRVDLQKRLEAVGVNPLEDSVFHQVNTARKQYAALLLDAANPKGLPSRLVRDRSAELSQLQHGPVVRAGMQLARVATLGVYKPRAAQSGDELTLALDKSRRRSARVPAAASLKPARSSAISNGAGFE